MKKRLLIPGAGFGGLELSTTPPEAPGDVIEVTLIDKGDAFIFGYSKPDVMFGRATLDAVRLPCSHFAKPGGTCLSRALAALRADKECFGATRRARWFGLQGNRKSRPRANNAPRADLPSPYCAAPATCPVTLVSWSKSVPVNVL